MLPENLPVLRAYELCSTQWRVGFAGASGLDYAACTAVLERYLPRWNTEVPDADAMNLLDLLDGLRTIEGALLTAWAEKDPPTPSDKAADE